MFRKLNDFDGGKSIRLFSCSIFSRNTLSVVRWYSSQAIYNRVYYLWLSCMQQKSHIDRKSSSKNHQKIYYFLNITNTAKLYFLKWIDPNMIAIMFRFLLLIFVCSCSSWNYQFQPSHVSITSKKTHTPFSLSLCQRFTRRSTNSKPERRFINFWNS